MCCSCTARTSVKVGNGSDINFWVEQDMQQPIILDDLITNNFWATVKYNRMQIMRQPYNKQQIEKIYHNWSFGLHVRKGTILMSFLAHIRENKHLPHIVYKILLNMIIYFNFIWSTLSNSTIAIWNHFSSNNIIQYCASSSIILLSLSNG